LSQNYEKSVSYLLINDIIFENVSIEYK